MTNLNNADTTFHKYVLLTTFNIYGLHIYNYNYSDYNIKKIYIFQSIKIFDIKILAIFVEHSRTP